MKRFNLAFVVGIAYMAFWIGLAESKVGEVSKTCGEPYPWYMPLLMAVTVGIPFVLGYLGNKKK